MLTKPASSDNRPLRAIPNRSPLCPCSTSSNRTKEKTSSTNKGNGRGISGQTLMTILGYTETRRPRRLQAGVSDKRKEEESLAPQKKLPRRVPKCLRHFLIYRGTFLHDLRTSQFWRRCKNSF